MRKFLMMCMAVMLLGIPCKSMAQQPEQKNPFIGVWEMELDTPMGVSDMIVTITEKDGKLEGKCTSESVGDQSIELYDVTWDGKKRLTFGMFAQGYDVPFSINIQDDGTINGSAMDMMAVSGHKK